MKVCHFISSKGLGRGEFYIDLINEQSKYIETYLLVPKGFKSIYRLDKNVKFYEYKSKDNRRNPFLYFELYNFFSKSSFDIVHTHFAKSTEIFYFLNKLLKFNHVATKHNPRKGSIFNKIENVTAVSSIVRETIRNKNVKIIYNGINPVKLSKIKKNNIFTIIAVGRLDKLKGFDILIQEISKLDFDFILQIVGDGSEKQYLEALIKDLHLEDRVKLLGFRTDIPKILASSHVQIITSHSEGFSIAFLEGLFYSDVVISTNVGIMSEILTKDFIINYKNIATKLKDIFENFIIYKQKFQLFKNKYQDKFLLENISNKYIKYYMEIINENSRNKI